MESEGSYSRLYFGGNAPLVFRSLTAIEQRLSPTTFFRANRSQIINLAWIEAVENDIDGRLSVKLRDGNGELVFRLGVGVDKDANVNAPSSLSGRAAKETPAQGPRLAA